MSNAKQTIGLFIVGEPMETGDIVAVDLMQPMARVRLACPEDRAVPISVLRAAPDLLDACREALVMLAALGEPRDGEARRICREAIAKATGDTRGLEIAAELRKASDAPG